ncbi:MAG TPA: tripartite tricarboxylate transporter permease [Burkholderiales bacterium]|nr:tripartite tricarboxylate transporter permease [Burkholderiales bacterium]
MLWDFIHSTIHLFTDPVTLLIFVSGLLGGMLFGAVPGVNMLTLGAVILPFTAHMSAENAIMLYSVIYCAGVFGGAITAILFNIPGAPENAPTALDGYPLTQKGQAGKAVGAAVLCSALGGFASALLMIVATPLIASWAVRQFGPPEIFALIFFGLTVAASVGAKTLWKGWLSVLLGLLIATVGTDPAAGYARFAFGSYYLLAGISFIPMVLGFFAISEVFIQGEKMVTGTRKAPKVSLDFPSFAEFWRLKVAVLRSMVIGFFAGILPGIGAVLAAFMSYSVAVRWSRHPERFGTGELEGVVASETGNNAATGAAMIPLLALGLPGGALTAMMLGVFQIHGMEPGPLIFLTSKELVWTTFSAMLFANIAILGLGWLQTKTVVHLLAVPFRFLSPAILLLATIGAYALRNLIIDVWVMFVAGIIGYFLRRSGYSVAGIVLGLVLGDLGEAAFVKTMQLTGYSPAAFLARPVCGIMVGLGVLTLLWNFYAELRRPPAAAA